MTDVQVEFDADEVQKLFGILRQKASNLRPARVRIAEYLYQEVMEAFKTEGNAKWIPLADSTKKERAKKGYGSAHPILQRQRNLISSITQRVDRNEAVIGTQKKYARIHQLGGVIRRSSGKPKGKVSMVKIPKRSFLPEKLTVLQQENIEKIVLSYLVL